MKITYKRFFWHLGTTSFRTKNFNKTIETQLGLLDSFWKLPENKDQEWLSNDVVQRRYYDYMKNNNFLSGDAPNKEKDAREKTSGLVGLGLVSQNRKLSKAGSVLLDMSIMNKFEDNNCFNIPKDSFLFAKQLLKTHTKVEKDIVRPFILLVYFLSKLDYLTFDEFRYLLPLCTNKDITDTIMQKIPLLRQNEVTIEDIIFERIMLIDNYKEALKYFIHNVASEEVIRTIVANRKSGKKYTKAFVVLYEALKQVYLDKDTEKIYKLIGAVNNLSGGQKAIWKKLLFSVTQTKSILNRKAKALNSTIFNNVNTEEELKTAFFKVVQTNKAKATLYDYFDLNRRYFKTSDIVLFQEDRVELDIIPKYFFVAAADCLYKEAFVSNKNLLDDIDLEKISPCLVLNKADILRGINDDFGKKVKTLDEVNEIVEQEKYKRLQHLIDTKFTDEALQMLLDKFQKREDEAIQDMVTDNADIPTIFEYVLGIIWYKISERTGKILDYMKLSLDSDLLPKTHAAGGEADIVYEYEKKSNYYPKHSLLLEATLADSTNQRRMEMEPVSRHLGQHIIKTNNLDSYCIFVTNYLDPNVIANFRTMRNTPYYDQRDFNKMIDGMKIIPIETDILKSIVSSGLKYKDLFLLFDKIYKTEGEKPVNWYNNNLKACFI